MKIGIVGLPKHTHYAAAKAGIRNVRKRTATIDAALTTGQPRSWLPRCALWADNPFPWNPLALWSPQLSAIESGPVRITMQTPQMTPESTMRPG